MFLERAVDYYALGRIATLTSRFSVAGSLLHHAVESLLKACLVPHRTMPELKRLGHSLPKLWAATILLGPSLESAQRQQTIDSLNRFEKIRYPEDTIAEGAPIIVSIEAPHPDIPIPVRMSYSGPTYRLILEDIDELWSAVFLASGAPPNIFLTGLDPQIAKALTDRNRHVILQSARGRIPST